MNKKILFAVATSLIFASTALFAQMSDQAVIDYVRQGLSNGKTQTQISNELMAKGVSASQARRLINNYKNSQSGDFAAMGTVALDENSHSATDNTSEAKSDKNPYGRNTSTEQNERPDVIQDETIEGGSRGRIYGHNVFRNSKLSFEPNENVATPSTYVLGPGDEVIIDVWGTNEASIRQTVSPEGRIVISQVGPIHLSGLTIEQATSRIRNALSSKYALSGDSPESQISVTLGNIRTIQVNVLGEVNVPGTYRLSSLSTVFNALYRAGGVTGIGSLRDVRISRGGKIFATSDIYKFLFNGTSSDNVSLNEGDVIIVPTYSSVVQVKGGVKRPMSYEMAQDETIADLLKYSGGFIPKAHDGEVAVQRKDGNEGKVFSVAREDFGKFKLLDGDIVTIYTNTQEDLYANKAEIKGAVLRPGVYAIGNDIVSVKQLVSHAGGLLEDAFLSRAQIIREKPDRSLEVLAIPIGAIISGQEDDVQLKKNDVLMIGNVNDIEKKGDLTINGYVINPGDFEYADGMTVEDLIMLAGGLENGASNVRVDVSRRINDPSSTKAPDIMAQIFSYEIKDGLSVSGIPQFILQPFDVVSVRKSPSYIAQKKVRISGEATFPGEYTLVSNNERISDLFARAGGVTPNGFIKGAMLKRTVTEDERNVRRNMVNMVKRGGENGKDVDIEKLKISETYSVGINLDKALADPGSEYDIVLHDGDELIIPSITNTVRVQGEVLFPNSVGYVSGKDLRYYIRQSGGFSNNAKPSKVYLVHMNGKVSVGMGAKVLPGCEIVVPSKPERQKITPSEWIGIGSSAASLTTMIITIANMIRK